MAHRFLERRPGVQQQKHCLFLWLALHFYLALDLHTTPLLTHFPPFAIDNIVLTGIDGSDPTIICPLMVDNYVDASCSAQLIDYTGLALANDACPGIVSVTQSPAAGTSFNINDTPLITLTATDLGGNQSECSFTQTFTDTISPTITCPGVQSITMNMDCEGIVGDYVPPFFNY